MAASAGAVRAGRAFVELFADKSQFVKQLRAAEKDFKAFGKKIMGIGKGVFLAGSAVATALAPAAAVFTSMGSSVDDMSQRTGIAADQLLSLKYAAEQSGSTLEDVEKGVRKMQDTLAQAAAGNATAAASFAKLGLNVQRLLRMTPDEQFRIIADRLSKIQNPALRAGAAMDIFGKASADLMPLIIGGAKGMAELEQESHDLGLTMGKEDVAAAAHLGDLWDKLTSIGKGLYMQIGAALAPVLTEVAETFVQVGKGVLSFVKENKQLIITVAKIAVGLMAAGAAVFAVGAAIVAMGAVAGSILTLVTSAVATLGFAWTTLTTAVGLLATPLGAVFAAVVAGGGAFLYFSGAASAAMEYVTNAAYGLRDDVSQAWQGIVDAVMAGDLEAAAKIVWLGVQLQFQKVLTAIKEAWTGVSLAFMTAWDFATNAIASVFIDAMAKVQTSFTKTFGNLMLQLEQFKADLQLIAALHEIAFGDGEKGSGPELVKQFAKDSQRRALKSKQQIGEKTDSIESDRQQSQSNRAEEFNRKIANRALGAASDITETEKALAKARDEFTAAIQHAADVRSAMESGKPAPPPPPQIGEIDVGSGDSKAKQSVSGTFSAQAAMRMGGSGSIDTSYLRSIAMNTAVFSSAAQNISAQSRSDSKSEGYLKEIRDNTKNMERRLEQLRGPKFVD